MKRILLFLTFVLGSLSASSQMITDVYLGETIQIENIDIEFVELVTDSRCPKSVQCIRAGEAIILVNVYENGILLEQKKLTFHATGFTNEKKNSLFSAHDIFITGLNLEPYPIGMEKPKKEDYLLVLKVI